MAAKKSKPQSMAERHKREWELFREQVMDVALASQDPDQIKTAKLVADLLKAYQEGERKTGEGASDGERTLSVGWRQ